jgi:hypothetical protein
MSAVAERPLVSSARVRSASWGHHVARFASLNRAFVVGRGRRPQKTSDDAERVLNFAEVRRSPRARLRSLPGDALP